MTRLHDQMSGVIPIAPTAFLPGGEVDHDSMARLYAHYVACGACGATVLGAAGRGAQAYPRRERGAGAAGGAVHAPVTGGGGGVGTGLCQHARWRKRPCKPAPLA